MKRSADTAQLGTDQKQAKQAKVESLDNYNTHSLIDYSIESNCAFPDLFIKSTPFTFYANRCNLVKKSDVLAKLLECDNKKPHSEIDSKYSPQAINVMINFCNDGKVDDVKYTCEEWVDTFQLAHSYNIVGLQTILVHYVNKETTVVDSKIVEYLLQTHISIANIASTYVNGKLDKIRDPHNIPSQFWSVALTCGAPPKFIVDSVLPYYSNITDNELISLAVHFVAYMNLVADKRPYIKKFIDELPKSDVMHRFTRVLVIALVPQNSGRTKFAYRGISSSSSNSSS